MYTIIINKTLLPVTSHYNMREVVFQDKLFVVDATSNVQSDLTELTTEIEQFLIDLTSYVHSHLTDSHLA